MKNSILARAVLSLFSVAWMSGSALAADPLASELKLYSAPIGKDKLVIISLQPEQDPAIRQTSFEHAAIKTGLNQEAAKKLAAEMASSATWALPDLTFSHWMVIRPTETTPGACLISGDPSIEKRPALSKIDMEKRAQELRSVFSCVIESSATLSNLYGQALLADMDKANKAQDIATMSFTASVLLADGRDKAQAVLADLDQAVNLLKTYSASPADVKHAQDLAKKIIWQAGWGDKGKPKIMEFVTKKLASDLKAIAASSEPPR